jgi:hypothetical protein
MFWTLLLYHETQCNEQSAEETKNQWKSKSEHEDKERE